MIRNKLNVIDLFCGCGGFSKGFEDAGYNVALGIDIWKDATITYKHNFPNSIALNEDITKVTGKKILSILDDNTSKSIDVIIGGPPCQGFSISGKRMIDDPRNKLYKAFVDIVDEIRPKAFVMENVPGLVRLFNGKVKDEVIQDFTSLGYDVFMQVLSADDYGVPQQRKRVFFVGFNTIKVERSKQFAFPIKTHGNKEGLLPYVTSDNAISDLNFIPDDKINYEKLSYAIPVQCDYQKLMRKDSKYVLNHTITLHKEQTKEIIAQVPDGGNYKNLPVALWSTRKVNIAWTRMNSKKPCFTIDTGHNHHFHYSENRVPTVRESARIQSFPDNFEFIGVKTSQLKQVGNAVPPILSQSLAKEIKKILLEI